MKKRLDLFFTVLVIVIAITINGCKKKDDPEPTKTELLTNKNWRLTAFTSDPAVNWNGVLVTNVFNQFAACDKDDLTKFLTTSIVNFDEGGTKCNVNDPQTTTGTWAFNSSQTIISVTRGTNSTSYNIESLSESSFKANSIYNDGNNNYTWSYTWVKN